MIHRRLVRRPAPGDRGGPDRQLGRGHHPARRAARRDGGEEGAQILDLIARLKEEGNVSMIVILHNYVQVFEACDRVNLIQDGLITLDKPTSETSVDELNELVVSEYRRARAVSCRSRPTAGGGLARRLNIRLHRIATLRATLHSVTRRLPDGIDTPKRE